MKSIIHGALLASAHLICMQDARSESWKGHEGQKHDPTILQEKYPNDHGMQYTIVASIYLLFFS